MILIIGPGFAFGFFDVISVLLTTGWIQGRHTKLLRLLSGRHAKSALAEPEDVSGAIPERSLDTAITRVSPARLPKE
jgi:hypothetical protein